MKFDLLLFRLPDSAKCPIPFIRYDPRFCEIIMNRNGLVIGKAKLILLYISFVLYKSNNHVIRESDIIKN